MNNSTLTTKAQFENGTLFEMSEIQRVRDLHRDPFFNYRALAKRFIYGRVPGGKSSPWYSRPLPYHC